MSHKFRAICVHPVNATPWGSTSERQDSKSRNAFCDFCAFCGELPFFTKSHPILENAEHHVCRQNDLPHCQYCKTLSRMIRPGLGWRGQARGQTGVSQRAPVGFQRSRPPDTLRRTIGTTPLGARASRPHPLPWIGAEFPCDAAAGHSAGGNRIGLNQGEPRGRWRSIRVEEMGEAAGGLVRAGRPRSRGVFIP